MQTLQQLFIHQLQDAYSAESQLILALPQLADTADSDELREGFQEHLRETQGQVRRLEEAAHLINCKLDGKPCEAMKGLLQEAQEMITLEAEAHVKDAGLIAAAQKVEHYEIALYGCLSTWAEELGLSDVGHLLHATLEEEKRADEKLTDLAERRINAMARR